MEHVGKIALGLSYFNSVRELPRCLDPMYKHFDYIIGVDGRYINYIDSQGRDYSDDGSTELLQKRYPNIILDKVKPMSQIDKRQKYFDIAGELGCNYLIVMDSDDIVYPSPQYQQWDKFFKNIERYSKKYPDYQIFKMKAWIPLNTIWRKAFNAVRDNCWNPYVRIHKDPANQRYCLDCHYWFAPRNATDEDLILQKVGMYVSDHTIDGVRITSNSFLRGEQQLTTRDRWAWDNNCEEQRRLYIKTMRMRYTEAPDWMMTEYDGYWHYDEVGKPVSKICEEDGTPVKQDDNKPLPKLPEIDYSSIVKVLK